jgi:hypothetical protein
MKTNIQNFIILVIAIIILGFIFVDSFMENLKTNFKKIFNK